MNKRTLHVAVAIVVSHDAYNLEAETTFEVNATATVVVVVAVTAVAAACISIYFTIINKHIAHNLSVACYLLGSICCCGCCYMLQVVAGKSIKLSADADELRENELKTQQQQRLQNM